MRRSNAGTKGLSAALVAVVVAVLAYPGTAGAFSVGRSLFVGAAEVPVEAVVAAADQKLRGTGPFWRDVQTYRLGRIHQMAYQRGAGTLLVEKYDSDEVVSEIWRLPLPAVKRSIPVDEAARRHLAAAREHYQAVVDMAGAFERDRIGGLQGSSTGVRIKALLGLLWCHQQEEAHGRPPILLLKRLQRELDATSRDVSGRSWRETVWLAIEPLAGPRSSLRPRDARFRKWQVSRLIRFWRGLELPPERFAFRQQAIADLLLASAERGSRDVYAYRTDGWLRHHVVLRWAGPVDYADAGRREAFRSELTEAQRLYEQVIAAPAGGPGQIEGWERTEARVGLARVLGLLSGREAMVERLQRILADSIAHDRTSYGDTSMAVWRRLRGALVALGHDEEALAAERQLAAGKVRTIPPRLF